MLASLLSNVVHAVSSEHIYTVEIYHWDEAAIVETLKIFLIPNYTYIYIYVCICKYILIYMLIGALIYIYLCTLHMHIYFYIYIYISDGCGLVYRDVAVEFERAFFIDTF